MSAKTEQEPSPETSKDERVAASWRLPLTLKGVARYRLGLTGGCLVAFFILFSFLGPMVYQSNQNNVDTLNALLEPSSEHLLGTDAQGFDVLGRLMQGGQISLQIGFFAALIATVTGTLYGAAAGLIGGKTDAVMMRFVDILMAIPFLFVALIVSTRFNPSVLSLSIVLGLFSWLVPARLVRSEVLSLRTRDYVSAARSMGAGKWRLVLTHLIPNALGVVIVNITFQVADTILAVATLGFLGFGLSYPETDWGGQLSSGVNYLLSGYWWLIYPVGLCLVGLVLAFNLVGEALRDVVDKRRTV